MIQTIMSTKLSGVRVEHDAILARQLTSHQIIGVAFIRVKVKHPEKAFVASLEHNHFIILMFFAYILKIFEWF